MSTISFTCYIDKITTTTTEREAELYEMAWFKRNPEYVAALANLPEGADPEDEQLPPEVVETTRDDPEGIEIEGDDSFSITLTDDVDWKPGDYVTVTVAKA